MADTTDEAYDSLGSSFVSSFSLPPPSPQDTSKPSQTSQTDSTDVPQLIIGAGENVNSDAPDPVVGHAEEGKAQAQSDDPSAVTNPSATAEAVATSGEDWKETLDKNLEGWRAESAEARAKSESTRLRLAEEAAAARRRAEEEEKKEQERLRREREDDEVERKVRELLAEGKRKAHPSHAHHAHEGMDAKRWNAVRSAWEIVQGGKTVVPAQAREGRSEFEEEEPVEVDGRDMTGRDHGGRDGNKAAEVLQKLVKATEAVTQGDGNLNPTPASATRRADLLSADKQGKKAGNEREAVAGAWRANAQKAAEEKGAGVAKEMKHPEAAVAQEEKKEAVEVGVSEEDASDDKHNSDAAEPSSSAPSHPAQPPSLTLSLFTSRITPARIAAVVGINILLPFINGVMLGFGEIFAREVIKVARGWWRGERLGLGLRLGGAGAGTVAGLGLREGTRAVDVSGSGSFP